MKLIEPKFTILEQPSGMEGMLKQIEIAGRTCYSPDTEVLTDNGWKRIDNVSDTDRIVSYNPNDNTIIYDNPNIVVRDYEDEMIEINHSNIKIHVTKEHRIYQSVPGKREYSFLTASQLAGIEKIPKTKQCRFRIPKFFSNAKRNIGISIPSIVYSKEIKHGNRVPSVTTIEIPCNKDFMVIAGAFISEGHTFHGEKYSSGSYCQITQNESSELYSNVITALNNLGWKYRIESDCRKPNIKWIKFGTNQCWVKAFDDLFGRGSKNIHLPIWFRELPDNYLEILIHNLYLGDGSHNSKGREKYLSISKRLLDEIQEAFILLGKNGTVHFSDSKGQTCYFEETVTDSWIISRKKHISTHHYKGKVYCTSTKSGIICIRYKGKTCWCGNCYRSSDKITDCSAEKFVERMKSNQHLSVLEHGTIYLTISVDDAFKVGVHEHQRQQDIFNDFITKYSHNKFSVVKVNQYHTMAFITTNYRVIVENGWEDDLQYQCEPTYDHEKRVTVRFNTDIGISREFNRHRVNSISEESTRYCLYSREKFGGELSIVPPKSKRHEAKRVQEECLYYHITEDKLLLSLCDMVQMVVERGEYDGSKQNLTAIDTWYFANLAAQWSYMRLVKVFGWSAQEARSVLPLDTATELVHTASVKDWENFSKLRCDEHAHPMARELAIPLREEFVKRGLIKE